MRRQLGESWGRLDHERWGMWWRIRGMRKDQIAPMMTGAVFWPEDAWAPCLKVCGGTAAPEAMTTASSRGRRHTLWL